MNKKSNNKYKISFPVRIILFLNFLAVLLLLISYTASYINPERSSIVAFIGLIYPFLFLLNVFFIFLWLFIKKRYLFISLIAILIGWNHIGRFIQYNSEKNINNTQPKLKILSYNVQNFVKQNITNTTHIKDFQNRNKIFDFIKNQSADIICIQEFLSDGERYLYLLEDFGNQNNTPYHYYSNYYLLKKNKIDAIATFSKYPIINNETIRYEKKNICIYSDIIFNNDTIRVYNVHLASIRLGHDDYSFFSDLTSQQNQNTDLKKKSKKILSKLKVAFLKRAQQVEIISEQIKKSPFPVIICGDFNDTPTSFTYHVLSKNLKDTFVESGNGFGNTYIGKILPSFRIDYIFYDDKFDSYDFKISKVKFSDHYPISCYLVINQ
ncbi:MAG: endonuclease/exonuclease/phosphatase family protein [Bacteroidales bacterium]|nr:endonuclease/exonuclease/phosphatase family protein [Bacteroidales bacterium]